MEDDEQVSVDYARFDRLVGERCTVPASEFPPGDVLLPESPLSISALLLEAAGMDREGRDSNDVWETLEEFEEQKTDSASSFGFYSDGISMFLYRLGDGRRLVCWRSEPDGFVAIALLRDDGVYPRFFEELIASCGDLAHVTAWGSLPMDLSVTVSAETLLRATFRFLPYFDNGEAWDHYAALGRAGQMPVELPGPMSSWVRQQDVHYWQEAYDFVRAMLDGDKRDE